MKKSAKIGLSILGVSTAGIATGVASNVDELPQTNTNNTTSILDKNVELTNPITNAVTNNKTNLFSSFEKFNNESSNAIDTSVSYLMTINNNSNATSNYGFITFEDESTSRIAHPGETIVVKVKLNDESYTLGDLLVYGRSKSMYLDTYQINENTYGFNIPKISENEMENWFDAKDSITIETFFLKKNISNFTYEYNAGLDSVSPFGSYVYSLQEDSILDDKLTSPLISQFSALKENGFNTKNTNFTIYLNNHILRVGNFSIPDGCNLIFLNNKKDNGTSFVIPLFDKQHGTLIVGGIVTRWNSVQFKNINFNTPKFEMNDQQ